MSPSLIAWIKLIVNESVETPVQSFNKETEASSFEHADRRPDQSPEKTARDAAIIQISYGLGLRVREASRAWQGPQRA